MKEDIKKIFSHYVLNTYSRLGPVFVKGKGSYLWDEEGERYLDLFPGWGVSILGHCHPQIVKAAKRQLSVLIHLPNNLYSPQQALLAKEIVNSSFAAKVFFANSGAEAVEGAIKFSRIYGQGKRYEIISFYNSFHGRTLAALSATGQKKYQQGFSPLVKGFKYARFNDWGDFLKKVSKKTVAVIIEPVQGEGGVNIASLEFIERLRNFCSRNDILLIFDEVQTGMGRTGKMFGFQNYKIKPDIFTLSKGLGAGVPISALVVKKEISAVIKPGMHASTFGGSPFVCRIGREVFSVIKKEKLLNNVKVQGKYLKARLDSFKKKFSFIKEVRSIGLMVGIELKIKSSPLFIEALKNKLIINSTHDTVLRVMPALNVRRRELDSGLDILERVFKKVK